MFLSKNLYKIPYASALSSSWIANLHLVKIIQKLHLKCNFPMTWSVRRSSRWSVGRSVTLPCANRSPCYNCIYIHIIHAHACIKPKLVYIHRENLNKLPSENVVCDVPIPVQVEASSLTIPWKRGRLRSFFAKKKIVRLNSLAPNHTAPLQTVGI